MDRKNSYPFPQVKEKELTKFDAVDDGYVPGQSIGFQARDLLRFFMVDIILILCVKLLLAYDLLPGLDAYVLVSLGCKVVLGVYLIWLVETRRDGWRAAGTRTAGKWWAWPVSLAILAAGVPFVYLAAEYNMGLVQRIYAFFGYAYEPGLQDATLIIFGGDISQWVRYVLLLFAIVIGPAMEELAFRGIGIDGYRQTGGVARAVVWTSLLFSLYHFEASRFLSLAAVGALFAVGRVLARSLWCSVFLHVAYNAFVLGTMWFHLAPAN